MKNFSLDLGKVYDFIYEEELMSYKSKVAEEIEKLHAGEGEGNDYLGWLKLPSSISEEEIKDIETSAKDISSRTDYVIVVGIGGSYLGAKFFIEAMSNSFDWLRGEGKNPRIIFAGQNIVEDYLAELVEFLRDKKFGIVVISKSGTTTEPAIAFRILKDLLEEQVGEEESRNRIIAVTDKEKGALKRVSDNKSYKSFIIPDDVGGRYSVLTPVGLLPIAIAGFSIREFINGAREMEKQTGPEIKFEDNPSALYAAARNSLYNNGKKIEILANYHNKLVYLSEWWKQLFGESEGKDGRGIFPASVYFTADLHSMGQYIQQGERHIFETVVSVEKSDSNLIIPEDKENYDQLNYLSGKRISEVNHMAELGTMLAHVDGGVPNIKIEIEKIDEFNLGQLVYFFEKACGISGYLLGVNPFNQPGVEAYKKNMFALLEKPGFEKETEEIRKKIN